MLAWPRKACKWETPRIEGKKRKGNPRYIEVYIALGRMLTFPFFLSVEILGLFALRSSVRQESKVKGIAPMTGIGKREHAITYPIN